MKKIVFIHLYNDRSGSPKVLSQVIKALKEDGCHTEILTSSHDYGFLTNIADVNRVLFYRRSENKIITLFYYILSQMLLFFQCIRYFNKDVIFYINTMMPIGGAFAAKFIRKKVIFHLHETSLKPEILKKFLRIAILFTADKIIFVSKYLKDTERFAGIKQVVVYNAFEGNPVAKQKIIHNDFIVIMVCSLKKYKGVFEFIDLADLMRKTENLHFQLVLNASENEIEDFLRNVTKSPNLLIFDRQENVSKFYQEADLLLNLSRPESWIETFGLTILEGMAYGLPAIVPPVGGPTEIVRNNENGFHISCYELDKIAKKIKFLMKNKDKYHTLSTNAKSRAKDFNLEIFQNEIKNALEDTVSSR